MNRAVNILSCNSKQFLKPHLMEPNELQLKKYMIWHVTFVYYDKFFVAHSMQMQWQIWVKPARNWPKDSFVVFDVVKCTYAKLIQ